MAPTQQSHRSILIELARQAMLERGLLPDFSPQVLAELDHLPEPAEADEKDVRDMRQLLWASIDNDDSRDLDQLSFAEPAVGDGYKILVAIADVTWLVLPGSAIDEHARTNTTSVYTPAIIFPMLPAQLSTDRTSLNFAEDRLAVVVEMEISADGALQGADVYRAWVRNHAKLAYHSVGAWLENTGAMPQAVADVPGLAENLRLQDQAAQRMQNFRHTQGALTIQTIEATPVFEGDWVRGLEVERKNRASQLVENFMIVANGVTARFLSSKGFPSIRRVVLAPERWDRIVEIAEEHQFKLPSKPDPAALEEFLVHQKNSDPLRFPDLSLAVVKLLGAGQYVAELPTDTVPDHFGLAARDYTHSTAPNRRYPDIITQRLLKAALAGQPAPYPMEELQELAKHCTITEDAANKIERQMVKSTVALLYQSRIGETFDAIVTGASPKGTWVRLLRVPVEGKLIDGFEGLDVGHRVRVQLVAVDVEMGHIDFSRTRPKGNRPAGRETKSIA